ncbi:hypothetical protein [Octadecabacter antarcticus]|nr:hypothetical protein [Octadecabacter antarcticus]
MNSTVSYYLLSFVIVSVAFLVTFVISIHLINPLQQRFFTGQTEYVSLIYLPHGVRVLSAWLLGWKSIPIITLVTLYTHWLVFGASGFSIMGIAGAMSGITCATFSFWTLAKFGMDFRISSAKVANWRDVFLAGCLASVMSSYGVGLAFQHDVVTLAKYFVGDLTGMFVCLFVLMLVFKALRKNKVRPYT